MGWEQQSSQQRHFERITSSPLQWKSIVLIQNVRDKCLRQGTALLSLIFLRSNRLTPLSTIPLPAFFPQQFLVPPAQTAWSANESSFYNLSHFTHNFLKRALSITVLHIYHKESRKTPDSWVIPCFVTAVQACYKRSSQRAICCLKEQCLVVLLEEGKYELCHNLRSN